MDNKQFYHNKDLPLCLAPWHALTVNWNGNIKPDVHARQLLGNIKENSLDDIYNSDKFQRLTKNMKDRVWPKGCHRCKDKEEVGGRSRRTYFLGYIADELENEYFVLKQVIIFRY